MNTRELEEKEKQELFQGLKEIIDNAKMEAQVDGAVIGFAMGVVVMGIIAIFLK